MLKPESVLFPEQLAQLELLEEMRQMVMEGRLMSLFVIGECTDGETYVGKGTAVQNKYGLFGFASALLLERTLLTKEHPA